MNKSDYFIQRLREDPELRASFAARLDELCHKLMHEMASIDDADDIRRVQGSIRGLKRFQTLVEREIAAPIASDPNNR